jgi:glycosyltransferase involved in cell wall biosynthesis
MAIGLVRARPVHRGSITPRVSFVIAARNEEGRIAQKLDNTLQQDYPVEALEIIVASDCSTDRTDACASTASASA